MKSRYAVIPVLLVVLFSLACGSQRAPEPLQQHDVIVQAADAHAAAELIRAQGGAVTHELFPTKGCSR